MRQDKAKGEAPVRTGFFLAASLLIAGLSVPAAGQAGRGSAAKDECTITAFANEISRIVLLRLGNGFYSHRAYDAKGALVCDGEWSATYELNRQAAEILRHKGNARAAIEDRIAGNR